MEQVQNGEYLQSAYKHLSHSSTLEDGREIGIIGHRTYVAKARSDVSNTGDGGRYARNEIQAECNIGGREEHQDEQVAKDIAICVVYLFIGTDTAIYPDIPDPVGIDGKAHFPADSFGRQDGPVYLDAS